MSMLQSPPPSVRRRWLRLALRLALLPALILLLGGAYACASRRALAREIRDTPRDPATGVVRGTEPLTLDPPAGADAPTTACLLIHGFIGSRKDLADLPEHLAAAGFHVRVPRLPGHGTTPTDFAAQSPETLLRAVTAEYRELRRHYRAVHVVGFSMGGALATLLAACEPVDRLVLAAPYYGVSYHWYYILPPESWNALCGWAVPYVIKSEAFIKLNRREAKGCLYTYRCVPTRGVRTLIALGRRARTPQTLGAVHCPTLMIHADGDDAASPRRARAAFAALPGPKEALWIGETSNHHLFWDMDRDRVKEAVVAFLKSSN